jgi:hypothetical protein
VLGNNIKVHFAGAEQIDFSFCVHEAGVQYFLFSCFPFISKQFNIHAYPITCKKFFPPAELQKISRHTIMDSGLFTLMFGSHAGKKDAAFIYKWEEALAQFVNENNIQATCVEVDCQKVLGVEEAWKLRKRLREHLPNNRIINVFHYEDGEKGFDRLIEFSDYIAISVPEMRILKPKTYKKDVINLARRAKRRKPDIDIHLLGCTELGMLKEGRFCTSADSTAWQSVNRYGHIMGRRTRNIKPETYEEIYPIIRNVLSKCEIEENEKRMKYYSNYYLSAKIHRQEYAKYAGSQD